MFCAKLFIVRLIGWTGKPLTMLQIFESLSVRQIILVPSLPVYVNTDHGINKIPRKWVL